MSREAFEKWAIETNGWSVYANYTDATKTTFVSYARDDVQDCWEAWQSCEAEQSKRIASLCELGKSYARIADEKTKQNAELVDALEKIKSYEKDPMKTKLSGCLVFIAQQALAKKGE